jgi:hypothetical protein
MPDPLRALSLALAPILAGSVVLCLIAWSAALIHRHRHRNRLTRALETLRAWTANEEPDL